MIFKEYKTLKVLIGLLIFLIVTDIVLYVLYWKMTEDEKEE